MPAADRVEHTARDGLRAPRGGAAAQPRAASAAQSSAAVPDAAMRPSPSWVRWLARSGGASVSGAAGLCGKLVQIDEKCRARFCQPDSGLDLVLSVLIYIYQRYTIKPRKIS